MKLDIAEFFILIKNQEFKKELVAWMWFNPKQVTETQSGLTHKVMGMPAMPQFIGCLLIKTFLKPAIQNKTDMKNIHSASHLILFTTKQNSTEGWIETGRLLERFLLKTTELGIANTYHNQPCEAPELASQLQNQILKTGEYPMLFLRMGYADR